MFAENMLIQIFARAHAQKAPAEVRGGPGIPHPVADVGDGVGFVPDRHMHHQRVEVLAGILGRLQEYERDLAATAPDPLGSRAFYAANVALAEERRLAAAATGGATPHYHRTFSEAFYVLDGRMLDLRGVAEDQLRRAGVERVEHVDLCTSCRPDLFFSHRRDDGVTGRQGGLVWRT